jgi:hypothetical protein
MTDGVSTRSAVLFLGTTALSTIGAALGALESTYIATTSDPGRGALRTAAMIIVLLIAAVLTVPHVPLLASRWGYQRLYALSTAGTAIVWAAAGLAMLAGLPPYATLLVAMPFMGVSTGLTTVLAPLFARAYLSRNTMAGAYSRLAVIMGLSWGLGSLLGGQIFQSTAPGVGVLMRGILAVPLAVVLVVVHPAGTVPAARQASGGAWRTMVHHARTPSPLRTVIVLSGVVAVFALPYLSLIVPVTAALRQVPLVSGAGILMAGTSVGEVLSPILVSTLQRRLPSLPAAAAAALAGAACLLAFAIASVLWTDRVELLIWALIGVGFGASRYAMKSLELDAAVRSGVDDGDAVATVSFAKTALAPVGLLLWALLMSVTSVEMTLLVACAGLSIGAAAVWATYARQTAALGT